MVAATVKAATGSSTGEAVPWLDLANLQPRQAVLLALLRATCACLEKAEVPCWITGGTLLGALRHGGFIPHDDDIDLECLESDAPRAQEAVERHPRLSFRYGGRWQTTQVAHVGLRGCDVELDIFLREEPLEESRDFPAAAEVFPLRQFDFHGAQVPGPAEPTPLMRRLYGADWAETARVWSHAFNDCHGLAHDPNKVTLPLAEYKALVASTGYAPPPSQPPDVEETLEVVFAAGGAAEALKAARDATWLDALRRRNREQAEARLELGKGS